MPKFVDPGIFNRIEWLPTDVVVSSGPKQGTNWLLNIVHQLRMSGDDAFEDILSECLWPEVITSPDQRFDERLERLGRHAERYPFRIFKTHEAPPRLPFQKHVRYIVPVRNGRDTLVSDYFFAKKRTDDFYRLWRSRDKHRESFSDYFDEYSSKQYYWTFINGWWPLRCHDNVMLIHFNDLKKDLEACIRRVAGFLKIDVPGDRWPVVLEHCGFEWMKRHAVKFEAARTNRTGKMIETGGMIRKGMIGEHQELFSEREHRVWNALHTRNFPEKEQRDWVDHGGPLP